MSLVGEGVLENKHYSVLLQESVDGLVTDENGFYIDGTFGRGGHSQEILGRLSSEGQLVGFDKDPRAIETGRALALHDSRFSIIHNSFTELKLALDYAKTNEKKISGILLDLGVSSPQLDEAERGFSFMKDGPLDMRMDNSKGVSAAQWIASAGEDEMIRVFRDYGEERFAKRIARAIIEVRDKRTIDRTLDFAQIVKEANPRWEKHKHPATRVFQAVRIFINAELEDLEQVLESAIDILSPGGRLVVISFHSLEDRMVKRFFRDLAKGKQLPRGLPVTELMLDKKLKLVSKAVKASESEVQKNIRSRSAVMRIAERLS